MGLALLGMAITACDARGNNGSAPILLFTGTGSSGGDVAALEAILDTNHFKYATASSAGLNDRSTPNVRVNRKTATNRQSRQRCEEAKQPSTLTVGSDSVT